MASKKVKAVLTGNVGPNAFQTLKSAGIEIINGVSGTITEAIENYKTEKIKVTKEPNVNAKYGSRGCLYSPG